MSGQASYQILYYVIHFPTERVATVKIDFYYVTHINNQLYEKIIFYEKTNICVDYVYQICNYIIIFAIHANNILIILQKFKGKVQQFKKSFNHFS